MMFVDSHCHLDKLDLGPYKNSFDALIHAAHVCDVNRMLCVSIDLADFDKMYALIEGYDSVDASLGVHPLHIDSAENIPTIEALTERARTLDKVVAIGETGLDYFYSTDTQAIQQQSFRHHLMAADQLNLPVIVHTRDAREDTLNLINAHGGEAGGVLHCFTESYEMAMKAIDYNYMISFSGIVTFRNAQALRDVVKAVPLESILIETDSPYLAPVPHRGKKNEPKYVVDVAQCIADLKGIRLEALAEATTQNYFSLFSKAVKA